MVRRTDCDGICQAIRNKNPNVSTAHQLPVDQTFRIGIAHCNFCIALAPNYAATKIRLVQSDGRASNVLCEERTASFVSSHCDCGGRSKVQDSRAPAPRNRPGTKSRDCRPLLMVLEYNTIHYVHTLISAYCLTFSTSTQSPFLGTLSIVQVPHRTHLVPQILRYVQQFWSMTFWRTNGRAYDVPPATRNQVV